METELSKENQIKMIDLLDVHKKMRHNSITLTFKGAVTVELIDSMMMIISGRLEKIEDNITTRKKVYGVLLECLQNLCQHVENNDEPEVNSEYDKNSALFMIDTIDDGYKICTANFVPADRVEILSGNIEKVNAMTPEELKKFYNQVLMNKTFSEKGGAGLGLIDMARKSGNKLKYGFKPIDENFSFFTIELNVKK